MLVPQCLEVSNKLIHLQELGKLEKLTKIIFEIIKSKCFKLLEDICNIY